MTNNEFPRFFQDGNNWSAEVAPGMIVNLRSRGPGKLNAYEQSVLGVLGDPQAWKEMRPSQSFNDAMEITIGPDQRAWGYLETQPDNSQTFTLGYLCSFCI